MGKRTGMISIFLGAALILSALFLYGYNRYEDAKSGSRAEAVVKRVKRVIPETVPSENEEGEQIPVTEMPEIIIDDYGYVGYITIPDLSVELPIMSDWSYEKLRIAPCRQFGSSRTDDLVIAAHNYDSFFGGLKNLSPGAAVLVTDMDGTVHRYQIVKIETLEPTDVSTVQYSGYDLVLYTCTYGGKTRVTTFCSRI
ncbi:MAG: sortase [Eubacteriales bacterium]|nr:sortase [Eubacteriales bacterium]